MTVALANVDRLERVTLEFPSTAIEEPVLEDLVRLMLGRDSAFLKRAPTRWAARSGLEAQRHGTRRESRTSIDCYSVPWSKRAPRCRARTPSPR